MKPIRYRVFAMTALASLAFSAAGCFDSDEARAGERRDTSTATREAIEENWDDLKAYTIEKRSDFERSIDERFGRLEREWNEHRMDASAGGSTAGDALKERFQETRKNLDELGASAADTWEDARDKVVEEMRELSRSIEKLRNDAR